MDLKNLLTRDVIDLALPGSNKQEVIESLLDLLMKTGKVGTREAALQCILEREEKMSTGIQDGVAIPHGKCKVVEELVACLGIKKEGVDFASLDGQPSTIFVMTLSPESNTGPHIQFLATISKLLKESESREALRTAESVEDILRILYEE